ncbi:MAG: hypothetical protein BWY77_01448 [bacterium ADurb.Bin431]|nr:MAG: hypothetical protein BWY77_01448 [bacterium ADurb.Bin431]
MEDDHGQGAEHRRNHGPDPGDGDEKKNVPGQQGGGPIEQQLEGEVVKEVPDAEEVEKAGEAGEGGAAPQPADGREHHQGADFTQHLGEVDPPGHGRQRKIKALRVVEGAEVDHDDGFEKTHGGGENRQPEQFAGFFLHANPSPVGRVIDRGALPVAGSAIRLLFDEFHPAILRLVGGSVVGGKRLALPGAPGLQASSLDPEGLDQLVLD